MQFFFVLAPSVSYPYVAVGNTNVLIIRNFISLFVAFHSFSMSINCVEFHCQPPCDLLCAISISLYQSIKTFKSFHPLHFIIVYINIGWLKASHYTHYICTVYNYYDSILSLNCAFPLCLSMYPILPSCVITMRCHRNISSISTFILIPLS